jgi:Ca2+-binding RTX toxin-like protein
VHNTAIARHRLHRSVLEVCETRRMFAGITSATTVNGTISTDTEVDTYTIVVKSGDPIVVALGNPGSGGFIPRVQVLNPSGTTLADTSAQVGLGTSASVTAASTGTYTIRVFSNGQNASGNYTLTAFAIGAQADNDASAADSGRRFAANVGPGDLDVWTMSATPGQQLSVIATENVSGDNMELSVLFVAPDGTIIANQNNAAGLRIDHKATQTGTYYAVVSEFGADEAGTYGITFTRVPGLQYSGDPDTTFLAAGQSRAVNVPSGDADVWSFFADEGVDIFASLNASNGSGLNPQLLLYGPDGELLDTASGSTGASVSSTAPSTGKYWVIGRDLQSDTGGNATFTYTLSSGTGAGPIVDGVLTVNGTSAADNIIFTRSSDDLIVTINGVANAYATSEINTINVYSGNGNDNVNLSAISIPTYVSAGSGDDIVTGGSGNDSLTGGAGKNRLFGGNGDDRFNGSNGRDFFYGEGGSDRLYGNDGNDYLDGGGGVDRLYGGFGDDYLIGGSSNDKMYANEGNDTLNGGSGRDLMNGDAGSDVFYAREGYIDIVNGGAGSDFGNLDDDDDDDSVEVIA